MKGIRAFDPKERRKVRRRNHIARDLMSPKYNQKIHEVGHDKNDTSWKSDIDDYYNKDSDG